MKGAETRGSHGFFGDFGLNPQYNSDSDATYDSELTEEKSAHKVQIQTCENCIDSIDDVIVELDNAIMDGIPQNDSDSPMHFDDYREPMVSSSKSLLKDVEEIFTSAQAKNVEKLTSAASSSLSAASIMKEAVLTACSTLTHGKQTQILTPVKAIAVKLQDQIYNSLVVIGTPPLLGFVPHFSFVFFLFFFFFFFFFFFPSPFRLAHKGLPPFLVFYRPDSLTLPPATNLTTGSPRASTCAELLTRACPPTERKSH